MIGIRSVPALQPGSLAPEVRGKTAADSGGDHLDQEVGECHLVDDRRERAADERPDDRDPGVRPVGVALARDRQEEVGDPWAIAVSHNNLGMIALLQEDYARATEHIEESMRLAAEVGDRWIVAVGQHNNGNAQRGLGDYQASGAAYLAALQAYLDHDDRWSLALLVEDVALLAVAAAREEGAFRLIGAADTIRAELDAPRPPALTAVLDAALAGPRARLGSRAELAYRDGRDMKIDAIAAAVRVTCL